MLAAGTRAAFMAHTHRDSPFPGGRSPVLLLALHEHFLLGKTANKPQKAIPECAEGCLMNQRCSREVIWRSLCFQLCLNVF